jgi:hypothetical protein
MLEMQCFAWRRIFIYAVVGVFRIEWLLIRALSAHSAAEFNSSPGRWQQVRLVCVCV